MPLFNHERYVVEAIDSVRHQDFADWELIIVDDGSTDASCSVALEHLRSLGDDSRLTLLSQANGGSHAAINRGLEAARGRYLTILNSDDRYASGRLSRLVQVANAGPGDVFLTTAVRLVDANGGEVRPGDGDHWWIRMYEEILSRLQSEDQTDPWRFARTLLWGNFTVSTSNFFLSRTLATRIGPLTRYRYVPDWQFALRVAVDFPESFGFLPDEPLLDYRLHGANTILSGRIRNHLEAAHILRRAHKALVSRGQLPPPHALDRVRYLDRFIRQELGRESAVRSAQERSLLHGQIHRLNADMVGLQGTLAQTEMRAQVIQAQLESQRDELRRERDELRHVRDAMLHSTSWRITRPVRWVSGRARAASAVAVRLLRWARSLARRHVAPSSDYPQWLRVEQQRIEQTRAQVAQAAPSMAEWPRISVVVPVFNTDPVMLRAAVSSVLSQIYEGWELVLSDDASSSPATVRELERIAALDRRIRVLRNPARRHISRATNAALACCTGEFVAFLDHDDELAPHALLLVAQALAARPATDLLYTDEDKLDGRGCRCLPLFKPDWSPTLACSQNYVGHLMCVRRSLLDQVGGLQAGVEGSQDHDLLLRLVDAGASVHHLPEVLYHWRLHDQSTGARPDSKPYAHGAGKQAVARHLQSRYPDHFVQVDDGEAAFIYQPRFKVPQDALVSIIIPTKDRLDLLAPCVQSILSKSTWAHFEVLVMDNASTQQATTDWFQQIQAEDARVRVVPAHIPFNWSRINNLGRARAKGQVLVFLNNDTLVISPDWLQDLMQWALLPDVATVGPMLLFEDGTIQHAGVVVGMGGWADHVYRQTRPVNYPSPFIANVVARNVLANTGACVALAADRFDELGGWDEAFEICGSDVEMGIRAHQRGWQNVYLPSVRLHHLESKTRSPHVPEIDFEQSALKYGRFRTEGDPFFNPHLDPMSTTPQPLHRLMGASRHRSVARP